jgi:hypothetical protein
MRKWFLNLQEAFLKSKINIKFLLASLKTFTNSKSCSESLSMIYFCPSFSSQPLVVSVDASLLLVDFSGVDTIAGLRNNIEDHRWLPECMLRVQIAAVGSLKRVTEMIFRISK